MWAIVPGANWGVRQWEKKMQIEDDRTDEQRKTHTILVGGTDRCLSGWGKAEGGKSYAFWACLPEHEKAVTEWVERRSDLARVRVVGNDYKPKGPGHCHVYHVRPGHPALESWERTHSESTK